jgi:hypothetical protein
VKRFHVNRLLKLADLLDGVPPSQFDMGAWKSPCGTTCCAMGWGCTIPSFRKAGLKLTLDGEDDSIHRDYYLAYEPPGQDFFLNGLWAAADFFDISYLEAKALFITDKKEKPKTVAKRIRKFALMKLEELKGAKLHV